MKILVTGGAGYIGSHVVLQLLDAGHEVVVVDDLSTGRRELVAEAAGFVRGDMGDMTLMGRLIDDEGVGAVLHFAGSIVVPESVADPLKYYFNNTAKTRNLIEICILKGVKHFVFSSTAAVYGEPEEMPVTEDTPLSPINPYGRSKLMTEWMLRDISQASDLRFVALRYFNVAGADPEGRTGQATPNATHLIKVATQTALGLRPSLSVFGTDYPTPDGTCIRDYIHVSDLADVHVLAMAYLLDGGPSTTLNCGYGRGFSVREVIDTVRRISGTDFPTHDAPRRPGDPAILISDPSRLHDHFDWRPRHAELDKIIETALAWESGSVAVT